MSKEFQIKDGDLIASFDLENEGGDIDFCDLFKISNGVANKIGTFIDYDVTNKIIGEQSKQISDLQLQLAEKGKAIETLKKCEDTEHFYGLLEDKRKENNILVKAIEQANQDKISFAVEQLEKVKEWCENHKFSDEYDYVIAYEEDEEDASGCEDYFKDYIDNQIKQLKEKNNG